MLVEALAYVDTTDFAEYLEIAEGLNISILGIIAAEGTSLSLPARTLYVANDAGPGKSVPSGNAGLAP